MNELLSALSLWVIDYLIVATALLVAAALVLWCTRQPAQRIAVAWGTMGGLTVLAVATAMPNWPRSDVRTWTMSASSSEAEALLAPVVTIEERVISADDEPPIGNAEPAPLPAAFSPAKESLPGSAAIRHWQSSFALAWLAAAGLALGWISLGAVQAWRLLWTARKSPLWTQSELARLVGKRRKPRLKTSDRIGSAVALGALRPAIVLPAEHVRDENQAGIKAALAHEWAHIRHGDLWLLAWQRFLLPLLAAHPLFWLLRRQIRADQELLADIAAAGEKPVEYAEALLAWAKQSGPRPSAALAALAMWENPPTVSRRIQMILNPKAPVAVQASGWWRWLLAMCLVSIACGLSLLSIRSAPAVAQETAPAPGQEAVQTHVQESPSLSFFFGQTNGTPQAAQIEQVELSVAMIRLGKEGEKTTTESIRDLARHFGDNDNMVFDSGVCVVALPREQVAWAIKTLREAGQAQILSNPKLMTPSGRDAYVSDGGEFPSIRETDYGDRRIERIEFKSLRSLRIRPEIRTPRAGRDDDLSGGKAASIVRLSVTRENIEPIDELDPYSETEQTRPRMITRQLTFTADVPIGRTLLVWELKAPAEDAANLLLITPVGIHRVTRETLANPQPLALDFAFPTTQPDATPQVHVWPNDAQAQKQMKDALEKLRAEAASNSRLRAEMQQEAVRLQKQIADLTTQLKWLRSLTQAQGRDQVSDVEFARRVYLDLLGVLPLPDELKAFVDSSDEQKREKLIDKLLGDPKVADHWAQSWKKLIAGGDQVAAEPKLDDQAASPAPETSVSVIPLRYMPSQRAAELLKEVFQANAAVKARISADVRTNSLLFHGNPKEAESLKEIIRLLDQPGAEVAPRETSDRRAVHDPATERKLLEIDLQAAENELALAKAEFAEMQNTQRTSPGAVSAYDVRRKEGAVRQAELRVSRIKILLDALAAKGKADPNSPLSAIEEEMVPPKNLPERIWQSLGLKLDPTDDATFKKFHSPFRGGLTVTEVRPDSPADDRGIRQGDILTGLGRWEMRSPENVAFVLENDDLPQAGEIDFHILREGKALVGRLPLARSSRRLPATAAAPSAAPDDPRTRIRLAEIDLREAQLKLAAASKRHQRLSELAKQNTVPQSDLDEIALERQHAELAVERAEIVLEGLKSPLAKPPK